MLASEDCCVWIRDQKYLITASDYIRVDNTLDVPPTARARRLVPLVYAQYVSSWRRGIYRKF